MDKRDSYSKCLSGPGGINCPCCRRGTKVWAKKANSRGKRRAARQEIKRQGMDGADFARVMVQG